MARRRDASTCRACFEHGRPESSHGAACQDYDAQVRWNRKMARLLAAEPDRNAVPAPPDYSTPEAVRDRAREAGSLGLGDLYAALDGNGRPYRLFRKALAAAGQVPQMVDAVTNTVSRPTGRKAPSRARKADKAA